MPDKRNHGKRGGKFLRKEIQKREIKKRKFKKENFKKEILRKNLVTNRDILHILGYKVSLTAFAVR